MSIIQTLQPPEGTLQLTELRSHVLLFWLTAHYFLIHGLLCPACCTLFCTQSTQQVPWLHHTQGKPVKLYASQICQCLHVVLPWVYVNAGGRNWQGSNCIPMAASPWLHPYGCIPIGCIWSHTIRYRRYQQLCTMTEQGVPCELPINLADVCRSDRPFS